MLTNWRSPRPLYAIESYTAHWGLTKTLGNVVTNNLIDYLSEFIKLDIFQILGEKILIRSKLFNRFFGKSHVLKSYFHHKFK